MDPEASAGLFDVLDDLFVAFDQSGSLVEWNRAVVEVTGYTDETLSSMALTDFFAGTDIEAVREAMAEARETGETTVGATLVTAAGERHPYEFKVTRLPDDESAAYVGVGRDVSERRAAERERNAILDRMTDAFFAVDEDWRVTYANERGREVLARAMGRDPENDIEGAHLWEEIPEAVDTAFYEQYHEAMETQEPVTFEAFYEPLEGWFDVRAYPSTSGLSVYFSDATERRHQHEELASHERVLREMYEIIADRDRSFDEQVTALLELGRAELDVAYGTLSEIRGEEYLFEIVSADDDAIEAGDVVPLAATNCEIVASTERRLVLGDVARDAPEETDRAGYVEWGVACYVGAPVFVDDEVYGTFCFYDTQPRDGDFSEWESTLVDLMSRWVGYELERERATERLERQNERLERFASIVSHDLRNPLNVAEGNLELAREERDSDRLDTVAEAHDRMRTLVDDLLTLARAGTSIEERTAVDLGALVEACWTTVETADATLAVETERTVSADEDRLRQLLENLVHNAVEHGGPEVTVTVGDLPDGFYVADDGGGIPEDERERVFEHGHSTADDGTGFGLAIVAEIAEAHGWDVRLTESDAGGARFEFTGVTRGGGASGRD